MSTPLRFATLTAKPGASQRTRNRIREHPGPLLVKLHTPACEPLNGAPAWFFEAPDGWFGWLPHSEIEIEEVTP